MLIQYHNKVMEYMGGGSCWDLVFIKKKKIFFNTVYYTWKNFKLKYSR